MMEEAMDLLGLFYKGTDLNLKVSAPMTSSLPKDPTSLYHHLAVGISTHEF